MSAVAMSQAVVKAIEERARLLQFVRILASYGCVETDPDIPVCGKCAPCEAAAYLREIGER